MSVAVATHNLEPMPNPTPPSHDPIAVLALAFSVAALTLLITGDTEVSVTVGSAVISAPWIWAGGRRK